MLQVKNLTITHKKDLTTLEGNGKSTVLKLLYVPALVEPYAEWTGEIVDRGLRKGYLAQELSPEELTLPVWEFCQDFPAFEGADCKALDRAARQVGLDVALLWDSRAMSTLSGGERVKLRLALLLLDEPDVLLLDEPSNDLDLTTLEWLEGFLLGCKVPVLYISHDELLLEHTANMIIHLERLRRRTAPRCTVARTGYVQYVEQRAAGFARQQAVITRQDPHGGQLLKKKMHAVQSMGRRFQREREDMTALPEWEEAILTAFDQGKSAFPAGKTALRLDLPELAAGGRVLARGVRLWVTGPEKIGIVGPNGAGKSTLLKIVTDQLLPRPDIRAAYMPQDYGELLLGNRTPVELLAPSGHKDDVTKARTLLGSMKYKAEEMEHPAIGLSGGQRAKLLFLSMVLGRANVLVLDEPTRNFSPLSAPVIRRVLAEFPGVIISVSHDRLYLGQVCTRVLELTAAGLTEQPAQ